MKIAIVGSGISGLACAYLLKEDHEVTLFEADAKPGGHVNTVEVTGNTGTFQVDTGFIVFNEQNYPNFVKLLDQLGVESQDTRMGFSVRSEKLGLEYSGESFRGLFEHLRNLSDICRGTIPSQGRRGPRRNKHYPKRPWFVRHHHLHDGTLP